MHLYCNAARCKHVVGAMVVNAVKCLGGAAGGGLEGAVMHWRRNATRYRVDTAL